MISTHAYENRYRLAKIFMKLIPGYLVEDGAAVDADVARLGRRDAQVRHRAVNLSKHLIVLYSAREIASSEFFLLLFFHLRGQHGTHDG